MRSHAVFPSVMQVTKVEIHKEENVSPIRETVYKNGDSSRTVGEETPSGLGLSSILSFFTNSKPEGSFIYKKKLYVQSYFKTCDAIQCCELIHNCTSMRGCDKT